MLTFRSVWLYVAYRFSASPLMISASEQDYLTMGNVWGSFLLIAEIFILVAYLFVLFHIFGDLFRNIEMPGLIKALWILALILPIPFVALAYIVLHGRGMAQRQRQALERAKSDAENYIRRVAGKSPAEQIAEAKALLEAGTVTADEFAQLKSKALAA